LTENIFQQIRPLDKNHLKKRAASSLTASESGATASHPTKRPKEPALGQPAGTGKNG